MSNWVPAIDMDQGPRYKAIVRAIEEAIKNEELRPGQQLPTHRDFASALGVSVQTVARAYAEAERLGIANGEVGRGTFIRYPQSGRQPPFRAEAVNLHIRDTDEAGVFDFSTITPVVGDIHHDSLKQTLLELGGGSDISQLLATRPISGLASHREGAAKWLATLGVNASPDQILITNGGAHAIWTAISSLVQPGDVVATEQYVDSGIITNASILKLQLRGLPLDDEGIVPEALEELCKSERVKLLCLTPTYNNPTVSLMGEGRKKKIAEIVYRYGLSVVEDDVYGPLPADRPKPFWSFAPDRTCYVTSYSKSLMHSLRTGYLVGPEQLMARLTTRLRATSWMANTWTAEVATRWVEDGTAQRLLEWQRSEILDRHSIVTDALRGLDFQSQRFSLHVWLRLPDTWRSSLFTRQCIDRGVLVTPPDPFMVGRASEPHAVRIAIGGTIGSGQELRQGLLSLKGLLAEEPDPLAVHY